MVVELGAGCGFISAYVAATGKARAVHAVEASPALIPLIAATHALNGRSAEIHNGLVGAAPGERDFFLSHDFWGSRVNGAHGARLRLPMHAFAERMDAWWPSLVILDIEGGARHIARIGFPPCVERVSLAVHDWVYGLAGVEEIKANMTRHGFRLVPQASQESVLSYERALGGRAGSPG